MGKGCLQTSQTVSRLDDFLQRFQRFYSRLESVRLIGDYFALNYIYVMKHKSRYCHSSNLRVVNVLFHMKVAVIATQTKLCLLPFGKETRVKCYWTNRVLLYIWMGIGQVAIDEQTN